MKRTRVELVCDVHGDTDATGHTLALDGVAVAVDLCSSATSQLHHVLTPYIDAARRLRPDGTPFQRTPRKAVSALTGQVASNGNGNGYTPTRTELPFAVNAKEARSWWRRNPKWNGERLPTWRANGALPRAVTEAYREAMSSK